MNPSKSHQILNYVQILMNPYDIMFPAQDYTQGSIAISVHR